MPQRLQRFLILTVSHFLLFAAPVLADRLILTTEQNDRLAHANVVAIHAIALTENGEVAPAALARTVGERLKEMGYIIANNRSAPHDVLVSVKCEERKTWTGISRHGGAVNGPGAPSRLWKGPACIIRYRIDGKYGPWEYEVRTTFDNAWHAAQKANQPDSGAFALNALTKQLQTSDFPLHLAAHWHQTSRLVTLLQSPDSSHALKLKIIALAGHLSGATIIRALETALHDPALAVPATLALGHIGEAAIPILLRQVQSDTTTNLQVASVRALGEIGGRSGNVDILPPLRTLLKRPSLPLPVQTEIVRTLGKVPDQQSLPILQKINQQAWTSRSTNPHMQQLRKATDWSLWQINPDAHTDE